MQGDSGTGTTVRHDWAVDEVEALLSRPFSDLLFHAQSVHRTFFDPNAVQLSTLLSIKTGGCPEDCAYCPQSVRYDTGVERGELLALDEVVASAERARDAGATRFCMGAAWRSPKDRDIRRVGEMVAAVKALGLETCVTLGMLTQSQVACLKSVGLDYYNHNLDTSPEHYGDIITTRTFRDRLDTLHRVSAAGIGVCCGGIVGLGESRRDRASLLATLASLPKHPDSVPINMLVRVTGTPLADAEPVDPLEFVRTVAAARIMMPRAMVRLSAGRDAMSDELHALCFVAGANSIFHGDALLTTANAAAARDRSLFDRLGIDPLPASAHGASAGLGV